VTRGASEIERKSGAVTCENDVGRLSKEGIAATLRSRRQAGGSSQQKRARWCREKGGKSAFSQKALATTRQELAGAHYEGDRV
jgi:hypothetical protein